MINTIHTRRSGLKKILFGAPYYPEHWTATEMTNDIKRMQNAGFNCVRMGEFSWNLMEIKKGVFDFSFFEKYINTLGEAGIKTIFCTPTATPPVWLVKDHPGSLRIDENGRSMLHGSRQHCCYSSEALRKYGNRVTAKLVDHFTDNPHIIGWQTDNEFFCQMRFCYCESCRKGFIKFITNKYKTIEILNKCWGTSFWNITYSSFNEVDLPRTGRPARVNPSHVLDYRLFLSDEVTAFQKGQIDILRNGNKNWWIMHNGMFKGLDYFKFAKDLDIMGLDLYPMFMPGPERAIWSSFKLDATRSYKGNFIIPELQSGPGYQGTGLHTTPHPGEIRLFAYQGLARGADGILHFRWRTCKFGAEQYWKGILDQDDRINRRYQEVVQEGEEFNKIGPLITATSIFPDIGIITDSGLCEMSHEPITHGLPSPFETAKNIHAALFINNFSVGCVDVNDDMSDFKVLIFPSFGIVPDELAKKLEKFTSNGGLLIITARTGIKNMNNVVITSPPPGNLRELTGIEIIETGRVNDRENDSNLMIFNNSRLKQNKKLTCDTALWYEVIDPVDAEELASWTRSYINKKPAASIKNYGKGNAIYIGTYLDQVNATTLIPLIKDLKGVNPLIENCPSDIEISIRQNDQYKLLFILNHSANSQKIKNLPKGKLLLNKDISSANDEMSINPFGVEIIQYNC